MAEQQPVFFRKSTAPHGKKTEKNKRGNDFAFKPEKQTIPAMNVDSRILAGQKLRMH